MSTLTHAQFTDINNTQFDSVIIKTKELMAEYLKMQASDIDPLKNITSYGLDSIDAVTILGDLEDWLDIELPSTLLWDYSSVNDVSRYIIETYDDLTIN